MEADKKMLTDFHDWWKEGIVHSSLFLFEGVDCQQHLSGQSFVSFSSVG